MSTRYLPLVAMPQLLAVALCIPAILIVLCPVATAQIFSTTRGVGGVSIDASGLLENATMEAQAGRDRGPAALGAQARYASANPPSARPRLGLYPVDAKRQPRS